MKLIDADNLKYKNLAEVNGKLTYVLTAEEIDNAPTYNQMGHRMATAEGFCTNPDWNKCDLISREALKQAISENLGIYIDGTFNNRLLFGIIDNAPTVEAIPTELHEKIMDKTTGELLKCQSNLRPQGEWIPVSERLPKEKLFNPSGSDFGFDFDEVLCTTIWGDVRAYKFGKPVGHDRPHFWLGGGIMDEYVIAWQYKPEPYRAKMRGKEE